MNLNPITYTKDQIREELEFKMFPRKAITFKHEKGFDYILKQGFENYLNKYVYNPRLYQAPVTTSNTDPGSGQPLSASGPNQTSNMASLGGYVDLTVIKLGEGVIPGTIINIAQSAYFSDEEFMSLWMRSYLFGNTGSTFLGNLYRFNQEFHQFVLAKEVYNQLKRRYFNKNVDWTAVPGKIILGRNWSNIGKVVVFFYPHYIYTANSWEFVDVEYQFLLNCMYGELLKKEGIAQSEMKISGLDTNADELKDEGKDIIEKTLEEWNKTTIYMSGRRI